MGNEDKAIEILKSKEFSIIGNFSYNNAFDAIIEMSDWKDARVKVVLKDMLRTYYDAPDAYPEMQRSEDEVIKAIADKLNINLDDE